ncbi:MAG: hypothetical protein K2Y42_01660 [Hyphomicrobium sp.]|jgi:hypothetical protein|uniref:hypothetical protein n=1 Tax=Hyphomicrobium sp. TaxID=82 RepID=UPI0025B95780|nr:hypothetical protein [Hyphomicrobium sp.]MBX9861434.1 hypothetical protein [Hyphomicrobium sp.]
MRTLLRVVVALSAPFVASAALASTMAFEDNKLNFKSCDGANVTARWRGHVFSLSEPGKSLGDDHAAFTHLGWDGKCEKASWNADGAKFTVEADGAAKPAHVVRYVAPDGSKWVGMRAGDGFFVTRIARENEEISPERVKNVADWLARTSKEYTPGAELAVHLKATVQ